MTLIEALIWYLILGLVFAEAMLFIARLVKDQRFNHDTYKVALLTWPLAIIYIAVNWRKPQ